MAKRTAADRWRGAGTQGFQGYTLPVSERSRVVHEIGERGETAAYYNCVMDRATFYGMVSGHVEGGRGAGEAPAGRLAPRALPELGLSGDERWDLDATVRHTLPPLTLPCSGRLHSPPHRSLSLVKSSDGLRPLAWGLRRSRTSARCTSRTAWTPSSATTCAAEGWAVGSLTST
eukprot:COSAG04_NODE_12634_length_642_cov_1.662983_1_plen_173_part_10